MLFQHWPEQRYKGRVMYRVHCGEEVVHHLVVQPDAEHVCDKAAVVVVP